MINQVWLLIGAVFYYLRYWMEQHFFNTLLGALFGPNNLALVWISGSLGLAVLLGGIFLVLRQLGIQHSPVDLRKAAAWLIFLGFLFSQHAWVFSQLEAFRNGVATAAYQTAGGISQGIMAGAYPSPGNELPNSHTGTITIPALFPATTHPYRGAGEITALDLAAFSLEASEQDIVQPPLDHPPLPARFDHDYFNDGNFFPLFPPADNDARTRAVNKALLGWTLMFINIVPSFVALIAAGIAFGLSMTAMVLFCSLPLALPFVFFEATEGIALGIMRSYLMLILKTWIINLILAIFLGFNAYWLASGNVGIFVAMSFVTLYFCWQFQHLTRQTFFQAINAITSGIGQAVGAKMIDPVKTTQEIAHRTTQAAISAAAVVATGGAAAPAVAGALLSSVGAHAGGSALMYGAMRHQKPPGEFARRGLVARNSSAADVLTPEEQELATRAAEIQTGQAAGDRTWAANTLTTLGRRAQSRHAGTTALRQSLTQAGIFSPEEQQQHQQHQQREQMQRMEQALGIDLRGGQVSPAEMEEALVAAAVLEGQVAGDPAQAQTTLHRIGAYARSSNGQRQALRATLTQAGLLAPSDDPERLQRLQQILGVPPSATHLSPDHLEVAVSLAAEGLPEPDIPVDGAADPLHQYGAQRRRQRTRLAALRTRLVEAGILPAAQDGRNGGGSAPPPPTGATGGARRPPPPDAPDGGSDGASLATPTTAIQADSSRPAPSHRRHIWPAAPQQLVGLDTVSPPPADPALPPASRSGPALAISVGGPVEDGDAEPLPPPPPATPAMGSPTPLDTPSPAIQDAGSGSTGDETGESAPADPPIPAAPGNGRKGRNSGYWAWRAKQAPGQPVNKPRVRRKS
jgi:hypothetical protein